LEEHVASIFRVEAEKETSVKAGDKQSFFAVYSSTMKMEAACSSETSVDIQRTTLRYIPDGILHNYRCENLKSYIHL
jgi:hypothetical protein